MALFTFPFKVSTRCSLANLESSSSLQMASEPSADAERLPISNKSSRNAAKPTKTQLLFIDNFDSFTFNLVHYFQMLDVDVRVLRNTVAISEVFALNPDVLVLGPGPGDPAHAGVTLESIRKGAGKFPILGVCLGHQAIAEAFGGRVSRADRVMHGKMSRIFHNERNLFQGVPQGFSATRYHSLIVDENSLPECLEISAWTAEREIMGISHKNHLIEGIQFHPESIVTEYGMNILKNFLHKAVRV